MTCESCGSEEVFPMGILGFRLHGRCRGCGAYTSQIASNEEVVLADAYLEAEQVLAPVIKRAITDDGELS